MKKVKLLVIAMLTSVATFSQVEIKPGIKAGLNFAGLTNLSSVDGSVNDSGRTSFHFGGTVSFKFADFYTLQPEVLYSGQGATIQPNSGVVTDPSINIGELKIKADYLSFYVNNKFFLGGGNFNLQAALALDFLVNDENLINPEGFDVGVGVGVGYNFPFGLNVDVRYKQGLTDLFGRNVGNNPDTTDISDLILNQVFQVSFGYEFDF